MNRITNEGDLMQRLKRMTAVAAAVLVIASQTADVSAHANDVKDSDTAGFVLESVERNTVLSADVYIYRHVATGAMLQFINNDDTNKCFMLEFDTPPSNNKGSAHVFEHAAANGSAKYPSRSLMSAISARSYVTYANAMTEDECTVYPVSSLSEAQLLKMADYYTDLCFEPLILTDEDIFKSEAWRLTVDADGSIGVTGTIYSEMKSVYDADEAAQRGVMGQLYPGCSSSYVAGGIPEDILTLSYEEVLDFHDRYYVPSNCTAYLYGDIEAPEAFMQILDGYFTAFDDTGDGEQKTEDKTDEKQTSGRGYTVIKYDFPVSSARDEEGIYISYAFDLGRPDEEDLKGLYALRNCLNRERSYAMSFIRRSFPDAKIGFDVYADGKGFAFAVSGRGITEDDTNRFKQCVDDLFKTLSNDGISEDEIANFRRQSEINAALSREGGDVGVTLLSNMANLHSRGLDPMFYLNMRDSFADMSWFSADTVRTLASRYLYEPLHSAMSIVVPKADTGGDNDAKLEEALDRISKVIPKGALRLIEDDAKRVQQHEDDPARYLAKLSAVTPSDLTADVRSFDIYDETDQNGCRQIRVTTGNDAIDASVIYLDATGLSQDMLGYLALYVDLVNGHFISTSAHKRGQLADLINENTVSNMSVDLDVSSFGDDYRPYVCVSFMSTPDTTEAAFKLVRERLFDNDFSDPAPILEGIGAIKTSVSNNIANSPENMAKLLAYAESGEGAAYYENTHYIEYLGFLTQLQESFPKDCESICGKLEEAGRYLENSSGLVIAGAVAKKNGGAYKKIADSFETGLAKGEHTPCDYEFAGYEYPLAVATGGRVVSNAVCHGNITGSSLKPAEAATDVALAIMTGKYVRPVARNRYAAYKVSYKNDMPSVGIFTLADPNTAETMEVFASMPKACAEYEKTLTDDEISEYILRLHSERSRSGGEISDALEVINDIVAGKGADHKAKYLSELINVKAKDVAEADGLFDILAGDGAMVTAGSKELIEKSRNIYGQVLNPFAK